MVKKGLVLIKSADDLKKDDEEKDLAARLAEMEPDEDTLESALSMHIRKEWERLREFKFEIHDRLLKCLRARKGEYSDGELARIIQNGGADPIYLKLTGTKCRAASAWIRDVLLPPKDRPWSLAPTPISELPEDVMVSLQIGVMQQAQEMAAQGMQLSPEELQQFATMAKDKVITAAQDIAKKSLKKVETIIEDNMAEGDWRKSLEEFIEDFVTYPTAFLKGPYYTRKKVKTWKNGKIGVKYDVVRAWRRVSPMYMYPDSLSATTQKGSLIEHIHLSKDQLYDMIGLDGYNEHEIREVIRRVESDQLTDWMWNGFEHKELIAGTSFFRTDKNAIDGIHYWGKVRADSLIEWGADLPEGTDPLSYHEVDAILIGKCVIRAVLNDDPLGERPYHFACWDAVPGSIWGIALPEQMEDHQKMVNACARALATNMAVTSGPQVVVLTDLMAENEELTEIFPLKIWQGRQSLTGNNGDPVRFFQPTSNANELLTVLGDFERRADDVTNVPRYTYGNERVGGAGNTSSGLSMLMNAAAKGLKRAIAHIDQNAIQPTVYQTFNQIMDENPDPSLRGDCKVVPRGANALLIKDALQNQRKEFLALISNEMDQELLGPIPRVRLLHEFASELGFESDFMPSEQDIMARMKNRIPPEVQQMQADLQKQAEEHAAMAQELAKRKSVLDQQQMDIEKGKVTLIADKQAALKDVEQQRIDIEKESAKLEVEADRIEVQKIRLATLEQKLLASTEQKEAELERRLASAERRVSEANIDKAIAEAQARMESQQMMNKRLDEAMSSPME